jgi:hypothetical protein
MSTMVGGNLEQLQALQHQFLTESQAVTELQTRITSTLNDTLWTGPASDRFREDWNGTFVPALARLHDALTTNAQVVSSRMQAIHDATF